MTDNKEILEEKHINTCKELMENAGDLIKSGKVDKYTSAILGKFIAIVTIHLLDEGVY